MDFGLSGDRCFQSEPKRCVFASMRRTALKTRGSEQGKDFWFGRQDAAKAESSAAQMHGAADRRVPDRNSVGGKAHDAEIEKKVKEACILPLVSSFKT